MLPMFNTAKEAANFIEFVDNRAFFLYWLKQQ